MYVLFSSKSTKNHIAGIGNLTVYCFIQEIQITVWLEAQTETESG